MLFDKPYHIIEQNGNHFHDVRVNDLITLNNILVPLNNMILLLAYDLITLNNILVLLNNMILLLGYDLILVVIV
jgi:hypothetical protein